MKFDDIPQITQANYRINVSWQYLEHQLKDFEEIGLELEPDFQRAHVWSESQQIAYIEWILRGGKSGREILFNCPGWMRSYNGPIVLVDGLQRITAVRRFMNNEIPAFGHKLNEYEDKIRLAGPDFIFYVNDLSSKLDVLQWYLDINEGGTVHTKEQLDYVRQLMHLSEGG